MSWSARSTVRTLFCAVMLYFVAPSAYSQWFAGDLRDTTNQADYIIVTSAAYANAVRPLASYRASHNSYAVVTVLIDSVASQFPSMAADSSIRAFITWALTKWETPRPQFLLLAGNVNAVPSHRIASQFAQHSDEDSILIDQWYGSQLTDSQDVPTPQLAIGRFPAWTATDLETMITKTIAYEEMVAGTWASRAIAVADSEEYQIFEADASSEQRPLAARWTDTITVHVRPTSSAYGTTEQFVGMWNQGAAIINLLGMARGTRFSRGPYFTSRHVDSLAAGSPPVLFLITGVQQFEVPDTVPIAVALLQASGRGAVCAIVPSGLMYAQGCTQFKVELFKYVAGHPTAAIGAAWMATVQEQPWNQNLRWTLLGDPAAVIKSGTIASVGDPGDEPPAGFALLQNFPNPFNPKTMISCQLSVAGDVKLIVHDIVGREVAVLVDKYMSPGVHQFEFDGSQLSSGVYLYRMTAGSYTECRKMILMK